jgi:ribosomal protein L21
MPCDGAACGSRGQGDFCKKTGFRAMFTRVRIAEISA